MIPGSQGKAVEQLPQQPDSSSGLGERPPSGLHEAEEFRSAFKNAGEVLQGGLSTVFHKRVRIAALNLLEDLKEANQRTSDEALERQRAQTSLRASEARLQAALSAGRMATWDWDPDADTLVSSETMNELLGLLPNEILRSSKQAFKLVHPEDRPRPENNLSAAIQSATGWHGEFRIVRPSDGQIAWLEGRAHAARDERTGKLRLSGIIWDITERKRAEDALRQSEARLRLILESAVEYAIFSLDLERRVTSWSAGAERLLGYSAEEILGESADLIFTEEDRAQGAPEQETDTARKHGRASDERWHRRKSGQRFWGSGVTMAMHGPDGNLFGFVKVMRDHTDAKRHQEAMAAVLKQLEHALNQTQAAREEAENANRAKDSFLATLSHELRTPLTPVLMTAESLLKRKDLPSRVRDGLQMICRNVELETHFINDLLDLTRIARGRFELVREPLNVHDAIRAAIHICQPDLSAKEQRLTINLDAQEKIILGDFPRVQQIFWNLLKNASKFTPEQGAIHISTCNEPGWIVVTISDNGIGINPAALVDIFEAFRQGDSTFSKKYGGLGLGLAISRATVNALDGSIVADSAGPGLGATFTVKLPLGKPETKS